MGNWVVFKTKSNNCYLYNMDSRTLHNIDDSLYYLLDNYHLEEIFSLNSSELKTKGINMIEGELIKCKNWINKYLASKIANKTVLFKNEITEDDIKFQLSNNPNIVFEVTENCNLNCLYCTYGGFYEDNSTRNNSSLSIESAISVIDYVYEFSSSNLNISHKNYIYIGFYGGEPLLRIDFIKAIVEYAKSKESLNVHFKFGMTTNGVLLDKCIEILVSNHFELVISLDGNAENNSYRKYKNGKESFNTVYQNIKNLQKKHPSYFKDYVSINSVLHNKNNVGSIFNFIKSEFGIEPYIEDVSTYGLVQSKKDKLLKIYKNKSESINQSEDYYSLLNFSSNKPELEEAVYFVNNSLKLALSGISDLLNNYRKTIKSSGTCLPFGRKLFVTSKGKILPCENVPHKYAFGEVISGYVKLELIEVANNYNMLLEKMKQLCSKCFRVTNCSQCAFFLNLNDDIIKCYGFMNKEDYSRYISRIVGYIEKDTKSRKKIIYEKIIS